MNRDAVVAFTNSDAAIAEGDEGPSLPPLGDGRAEDLNPQRRVADQEARPKKRGTSKKALLVGTVVMVSILGWAGYTLYTAQPGKSMGESLRNLWPTSASSSPAKPDAMTLLSNRIAQIETTQAVAKTQLTAFQNDISALQQTVQGAASAEHLASLETQVAEGHAQLDTRLSKLEIGQRERIKGAARRAAPPVAATPALPFQVLSIDLWDGRPYVAVSVAGVTELLAIGDHRAGWAVLDINRSTGQAIFVHKDGATIKRTAQDGSA
ncbi:MAG: hypothetical protein IDH49_08515 [Gammaproteobacteria bacterium]|nr:hypothetical protein [Gammaproteobacteria bacterium]